MNPTSLQLGLGGLDIARYIYGYTQEPRALELDLEDLSEEIGKLGYDPLQAINQLVSYLRRVDNVKRVAERYLPFYQALKGLNATWDIWLQGEELALKLSHQSYGVSPIEINRLLDFLPGFHSTRFPGEYTTTLLLKPRVSNPDRVVYRLYTSLIFLDSRDREGEVNGSYTSYWVDEEEYK